MTAPRTFRLQFSLRGLLLATALVGLGLLVYRWPWEEVRHNNWPINTGSDWHTQSITFRRAWHGQPVQHGREAFVDGRGQLVKENFYADDRLLMVREYESGKLCTEVTYPPGLQESKRVFETWNDEEIVIESEYRQLNSRSDTRWRTVATGKVLLSTRAEYSHLQLWNDRPVEDGIDQLLNGIPEPLRSGWLEVRPKYYHVANENLGDNVFRRTVFEAISETDRTNIEKRVPHSQLVVHFAPRRPDLSSDFIAFFLLDPNWDLRALKDRERGPYIQRALRELQSGPHYTLVVRHGLVCVVPITQESLQEEDSTGIDQVRFVAGSPQEQEWNELVPHVAAEIRDPAERVQELFKDTSLVMETAKLQSEKMSSEAVSQEQRTRDKFLDVSGVTQPRLEPAYLRSRRDTLGILLWHHRLRVRQERNKLIITLAGPRTA